MRSVKLAPSAWREISLVISIHLIFLHLACVDNQPEIDCKCAKRGRKILTDVARRLLGPHDIPCVLNGINVQLQINGLS